MTSTVWHLCSNRWNSAIAEYALSATKSLEKRGWRSVFSPLKDSPAHQRAKRLGFVTRPLSNFGPIALAELSKIRRELNPDITITYGGPESFLLQLLPKSGSRNLRFIGSDDWNKKTTSLKMRKALLPKTFDMVLVPGKAMVKPLEPHFACPIKHLILGIDTEYFNYVPTWNPLNIKGHEIVLLGRLDPVKGHEQFFSQFAKAISILGPVSPCLHVVGEPANLSAQQITEMALRQGLVKDISFKLTPTRHPNVSQLMRNSLAGGVPSLGSEIICRVAEEFLLCGTPIAVSGVGSLEETLITDDCLSFTGLDNDQISHALVKFFLNASKEEPAVRKVRAEKALKIFSLATMGEKLEQLIGSF